MSKLEDKSESKVVAERHGPLPDGKTRSWEPGDPPWLAMGWHTMIGAWLSHRGFPGHEKEWEEAQRILAEKQASKLMSDEEAKCPDCERGPNSIERCDTCTNGIPAPVVMRRGLCASCSQQSEDESPLSCICEWCYIKHQQRAWEIFDKALATISGMGGPASDIAVQARNEARNATDLIKKEGS